MKKRLKSFMYAFKGIKSAAKSEKNMLIHFVFMLAVISCGFIFCINITEWLICIGCFGLVISAEVMNTAIETITNLISPEENPLAGKAKDLAAGAVLIAAISAAIIGLIIFIPKVWDLFV